MKSLDVNKVFFLVLCLMVSFQVHSTDVSGNLIDNDTWTAANSPYNIVGDVGVPDGFTLTIEAGVEVNYTGDYKILVFGAIQVDGVESNVVNFNGNSAEGTEYMLEIRRTDLNLSNIDYAVMKGPQKGISIGDQVDPIENTGDISINGISMSNTLMFKHTSFSGDESLVVFYNSFFSEVTFTGDVYDDIGPVVVYYQSTKIEDCIFEEGASFDFQSSSIKSSILSGEIFINDVVIENSVLGESLISLYAQNSIISASTINSSFLSLANSIVLSSQSQTNPLINITNRGLSIVNTSIIGHNTGIGINFEDSNSPATITNTTFLGFDRALVFKEDDDLMTVKRSNFLSSRSYHIENLSLLGIVATENYWDSDSPTIIATKIYDQNDDLELGLVDISGYLSTPLTDAPISSPQTVVKFNDGAGGLNITWSANPETDVAGYKIYWGDFTGYSFESTAYAGNVRTYNIPGLSVADSVAVTAYDTVADGTTDQVEGYESWFSFAKNVDSDFLSFSLDEQVTLAVIDPTNHTIDIEIEYTTNLSSLIATFSLLDGATAKVDNDAQTSGTTSNDFTSPVTYTVTAEDGETTQDWVVTVTIEGAHLNTETDIITFSLPEQINQAIIDESNHTLSLEVISATDITSSIASFTLSDGATAKVDNDTQISGTTSNDFTNPVTYTVTAEDGVTTQDWVVTVTIEEAPLNRETDIITFSLPEQINQAIINDSNHTINLEVVSGTDVTSLISNFTLSTGATAKVDNDTQVSGITQNDFTNPVTYTVTAEDGATTQDWTVSVTVDGAPEFSSITYDETYTLGSGGMTVSALITSDNDLTDVTIYYRSLSVSDNSQREMSLANGNYTYTFDDANFDDLGLTFYIRAEDINNNIVLSGNHIISTMIPDDVESIPGLISSTDPLDYAIISIPYQTANVNDVFSNLGSNEDGSWKLSHHDGGAQYNYYPVDFTQFEPGKGYWFLKSNPSDFLLKGGTAVTVDDNNPFTLQLRATDWNMIGNPFPYPIDWQAVIDHNADNAVSIESLVTFKNRQFNAGQFTMNKYDGALLFSSSNVELEIPLSAISSTNSNARVPSTGNRNDMEGFDTGEWEVGLNLSTHELAYNVSGIAMNPDASNGRDPHDWTMLPRFSTYLDLSFEQGITKSVVSSAESYTWDFHVNSNMKGELTKLSWSVLDIEDSNHSLVLLDIESQQLIDMGQRSVYEFNMNGESKPFKILYASKGEMMNYLDFGHTFIGDPYPNPFGKDITIPISIVEPDTDVKVTVYDILGKKIYQIEHSDIDEGYHDFLLKLSEVSMITNHPGTYVLEVLIQSGSSVRQINKRIAFNK